MYHTIRKNAHRKIAAILAASPLILVNEVGELHTGEDDRNGQVTADEVIEAGRQYGFERCYEDESSARFVIHRNFIFTAWKSLDAAKARLTEYARNKYGLN